MESPRKSVFSWSGGKDASMALMEIMKSEKSDIHTLMTTVNKRLQRVTMHGVPIELIQNQADSIGLDLEVVGLPEDINMADYSKLMHSVAVNHQKQGVSEYIYGDINLEDLRLFRDTELKQAQLKSRYPLWEKNTLELAKEFIRAGFKAIVVAVNSNVLNESFAGRIFDNSFLTDLPADVDPCGENGEFHTFVFDGPIFNRPVLFKKGEISYHTYKTNVEVVDCFCCDIVPIKDWDKGFWFCDLSANQ
jgi:uncharacterized protein (TIGR00290 family)